MRLKTFFMFAGTLSLVRLDGSHPNFHTMQRGGLAQTLEYGCHRFNRFTAILEKLFSHNCDCSWCTGVAFTLAQVLTKCHPLHPVHRFQLPCNNLMPALGGLILASSSLTLDVVQEFWKMVPDFDSLFCFIVNKKSCNDNDFKQI